MTSIKLGSDTTYFDGVEEVTFHYWAREFIDNSGVGVRFEYADVVAPSDDETQPFNYTYVVVGLLCSAFTFIFLVVCVALVCKLCR